jgi:hypothetical protein
MAAAIDTIEVLDNLQFQQTAAASSVCHIVGAGTAFDCVKSYAIVIPPAVNAARVIFNNYYDTGPCVVYARVKATLLTGIGTLAKTENTQPLEWTAIAAATPTGGGGIGFLDSGVIDLSTAYEAVLHIDCALASAVAHTGTEITVQVRSEATTPAEWTTLTSFVGPTGTPVVVALKSTANSGQKVVPIDNPTAASFTIGKWMFILNTTPASCEKIYVTAVGADA